MPQWLFVDVRTQTLFTRYIWFFMVWCSYSEWEKHWIWYKKTWFKMKTVVTETYTSSHTLVSRLFVLLTYHGFANHTCESTVMYSIPYPLKFHSACNMNDHFFLLETTLFSLLLWQLSLMLFFLKHLPFCINWSFGHVNF